MRYPAGVLDHPRSDTPPVSPSATPRRQSGEAPDRVLRRFAEAEEHMVITGRSNRVRKTATDLGIIGIECDASAPASVEAFAAQLGDGADVLVNMAGANTDLTGPTEIVERPRGAMEHQPIGESAHRGTDHLGPTRPPPPRQCGDQCRLDRRRIRLTLLRRGQSRPGRPIGGSFGRTGAERNDGQRRFTRLHRRHRLLPGHTHRRTPRTVDRNHPRQTPGPPRRRGRPHRIPGPPRPPHHRPTLTAELDATPAATPPG